MTDELFDEEDRPGGPRPVDHRKAPTRAGLVVPDARGVTSPHPIEMRKAEFEGLAAAIGLDIAFSEIVKLREVKPATFIGGGRLDEIKAKVKEQGVGILLFDTALAPVPPDVSAMRPPVVPLDGTESGPRSGPMSSDPPQGLA